jgi:hypothetical protein
MPTRSTFASPGRSERRPASQLQPPDLDDTTRFRAFKGIPILDVHEHTTRGAVDEPMLELIARNSNERCEEGNYALLLIGHTRDEEDIDETEQPKLVGFARNFVVGTWQGRPCLLADFFFDRDRVDEALEYPHRSVERWRSPLRPDLNYIEAISLLRFRPERDLGLLTRYQARPSLAGAELVRYARGWEPRRSTGLRREDLEPLVRYARERRITDGNEAVRRFKAAKSRGLV